MKPWNRPYLIPVFILAAMAAMGLVVMLLWNAIVPAITTTWTPITYLQAVGLLVLCRILFGGFKGKHHGHGGPPWMRPGPGEEQGRTSWAEWRERRREWKEKWSTMTDEERKTMRDEWRKRCSHWHS
jgi:hypothetical protein